MSALLHIQASSEAAQKAVLSLVHTAIDAEIQRLAMAISFAQKRLSVFEEKYNVASEVFMSDFAAEDLEGGDDEYVEWAGEYKGLLRLHEHLRRLQEVEYAGA